MFPETPTLLHTVLDSVQAGALLALATNFVADALTRKDRMTGWLAAACLFISIRHSVLLLWGVGQLPYGAMLKWQSVLASFGFIALAVALRKLFPERLSPRLVPLVVAGMLPNLFRNAALSPASSLDLPLHQIANATYAGTCLYVAAVVGRAKFEGDPLGRRMFWGLVATLAPVLLEVAAMAFFGIPIRTSGLAMLMLTIAMGASWRWLITASQEKRVREQEEETHAWRSLARGPTWHTKEPSPMMDDLFGPRWRDILKPKMVGRDSALYAVHFTELKHSGGTCGWIESHLDTLPGTENLLTGWTVALGLSEEDSAAEVERWLKAWGAEVRLWGAVPPKDGPYPSLLLWGREPVTLAVWREGNLARRMPRWVQLGGPPVEGPHAQLELPAQREALQAVLHRLTSMKA